MSVDPWSDVGSKQVEPAGKKAHVASSNVTNVELDVPNVNVEIDIASSFEWSIDPDIMLP